MKIADIIITSIFFLLLAASLICIAVGQRPQPDFTLYPPDAQIVSEAK